MSVSLLITLRETLETSLVVGILLAFLVRIGQDRRTWIVWAGVLAGLALSLVLGWLFQSGAALLSEEALEIYEGGMMFVAAGLLTWMLLWMMGRGSRMREEIERTAGEHVAQDSMWGIFFLTFVSVAREGAEMVIFLQAAFLQTRDAFHQVGAISGILIALGASYLLFSGMRRVPLKKFFRVSTVILLLFAAGLAAHGVHEWQEAGLLPLEEVKAWDWSMILPHDVFPGSLLRGLFGYSANPSVLEVLAYVGYFTGIVWVRRKLVRRGFRARAERP